MKDTITIELLKRNNARIYAGDDMNVEPIKECILGAKNEPYYSNFDEATPIPTVYNKLSREEKGIYANNFYDGGINPIDSLK